MIMNLENPSLAGEQESCVLLMNFHQKIDSDFMWYFAFKEWVKEENHDWIISHSFAPELWTELKSLF